MDLFRRSALQKMLSPEQLDQLILISSPRDWIPLIGFCILILAGIIWSIWGSLTIDLRGQGILIKPGGYRIIQSPFEGQIIQLTPFKTGDTIQEGQVIGQLSQPVLELDIESTQKLLTNLQKEKSVSNNSNFMLENQIINTQSRLLFLQNEWLTKTRIISPNTGSFLAMRASPGVYVKPGDSILSMEALNGDIFAIIFLPPTTTNIHSLKPGMMVKIFLGLKINDQEGYIYGKVREISKFPVSPQVLTNILNNEYLVKFFFEQGPPYLVFVDLLKDSKTVSGYKWSPGSGKFINLKSGSLCSAMIQVAEQAPVNFLIPSLKRAQE